MTTALPGFQPSTSRPKNWALEASSSRSWKRGSLDASVEMPRRMWPSSGWRLSDSEKEISKRSLLAGLEVGVRATAKPPKRTQIAKAIERRPKEFRMPEALERGKKIKTILQTGHDTTGSGGDLLPHRRARASHTTQVPTSDFVSV